MANVFEAPDEVIVIGYAWKQGDASGASREVFVSRSQAQRRLEQLLTVENRIEHPDKVKVYRLGDNGSWLPVAVHWPTGLAFEDTPDA